MVLFAYNRDIPDAPNNPSVDQPDMLANTNSIDDLLAVDHYSFNTPTGGIHKQVTLINEAAPGVGAGNGVLYANLATGQSWPFWQNALGSVQLIGGVPVATANNGTAFLGGGLILKWGTVTPIVPGGVTTPVVFAPAFPTTCFIVNATLINPAGTTNAQTISIRKASISAAGFSYNYSGGGAYDGLYWFAIGN